MLSHYDLLTVGEAAGVTIDEAKKYARSDGKELGMVFQFEHVGPENGKGSIIDKWTTGKPQMPDVRAILNKWQLELEGKAWNSLYLDNHDQPRCVSMFGNDSPEWRVLSAKMLATCLHMQKGTPYIYQGEEIGMTNADFTDISDYRDVESINYHDILRASGLSEDETMKIIGARSRDNGRTPMQWTAGESAGFTTGTPWLGVNHNHAAINVEAEREDDDSILAFYRRLIALRKEHRIIAEGSIRFLERENDDVIAYERALGSERLLVLCNFRASDIAMPELHAAGEKLIGNYPGMAAHLRPYEVIALRWVE